MKLKDQSKWRTRNGSPCKSCSLGMGIYSLRSLMSRPSQAGSTHTRMMYIRYLQSHYYTCNYHSLDLWGRFDKLRPCCLGSILQGRLTNTYSEAGTSRWLSASKTHNFPQDHQYMSNNSSHTVRTATRYYWRRRN